MYLNHYNLSIKAESKEEALEKLEENLEEEDMDFVKVKTNPSLTETELNSKEAVLSFVVSEEDNIWSSIGFGFSVSDRDKRTAESIYELLHGSLEDQAVSYKPDDRGRITLGSNYSDMDEVRVITLD